jgi:hypothetical protein
MDSIKIGLLCITVIAVSIGLGAIIKGGDKMMEVAMAALAPASAIGGWLAHSATSGKDPGSPATDEHQQAIADLKAAGG